MAFTYKDYLDALGDNRYTAEDDAGRRNDSAMSEQEWNSRSDDEKWYAIQHPDNQGLIDKGGLGLGFTTSGDSDIAQRWKEANPDAEFAGGDNNFYVLKDKPSDDILRAGAWQDPETGAWIVPHENFKPEVYNGWQESSDKEGFFTGSPLENIIKGAMIVFGGAALNNYLVDGSIFGAGEGGVVSGTEGFVPPEGGITPTGGLETIPNIAEPSMGTLAETPALGAPSAGTPLSVPPAMDPIVSPAMNTMAPVPNLSGASPLSIPGWDRLSSGTQRMILQGLGTGVSASLASRRQAQAQAAADARAQADRDWQTAERQRRGQLTDYTQGGTRQIATSRPIPGGLVATRMGGGG